MEGVQKMVFRLKKILLYVIIAIIFLIAIFPIYWTAIGSFKFVRDIVTPVPKFIFTPTLTNYIDVLKIADIRGSLLNSIIVVTGASLLGFILGVPAAYVFARFSFKHKDDLQFWILSLRMMPPVAVVIPFISIWLGLGLFDTYISLIVTYLLISLPIVIWLSIDCFKNVPVECEEAAMVEGCSYFRVFYRVALPIAGPTLIGGLLFSFILVWNEFFLAFVLTSQKMTMPVAAASFAMVGMEIPWGLICASICLLSIPPLILASVFSKFLQSYFLPKISE